jgi:hypothetical protein
MSDGIFLHNIRAQQLYGFRIANNGLDSWIIISCFKMILAATYR